MLNRKDEAKRPAVTRVEFPSQESLKGAIVVSYIGKIKLAKAELDAVAADPLLEKVQAIVRGQESIGTAPLLDLLSLAKTTSNGRRLAQTMRTLGFVPVKSRRLLPGGY